MDPALMIWPAATSRKRKEMLGRWDLRLAIQSVAGGLPIDKQRVRQMAVELESPHALFRQSRITR